MISLCLFFSPLLTIPSEANALESFFLGDASESFTDSFLADLTEAFSSPYSISRTSKRPIIYLRSSDLLLKLKGRAKTERGKARVGRGPTYGWGHL
jgi:hypothetical protein